MKKFIWMILFPCYVYGTEMYQPTILSLDSEYPVEISAENLADIKKQNVDEMFRAKRFPWEYVLGPILLAMLYLIVQQQTANERDRLDLLKKQRFLSRNWALKSLKELSKENLPQKQQYDDFYEKITFIVRKYIEDSYSIHAPTETTEEFLRQISNHSVFDEKTENMLALFLKNADTIKFSEHPSTPQECAQAQKTAEEFVSETIT